MADQKQHAKITPELEHLWTCICLESNPAAALQKFADALRDARLDIPTEAHGISVICTDGDGIIVQTTKIFPAAPAKGDRLWITPTGKYEDGQFWIVRDREWNTVHGDCRLYLRCQKEA